MQSGVTFQAEKHRQRVNSALTAHTFEHQHQAAKRTFEKLNSGSRAVVLAAEMQSGKSGIALALACLQRNSLNDQQLCDKQQLKDVLYLVTMADTALLEQAQEDLLPARNTVVSNFTHFRSAIARDFKQHPPKLIIIDECHYGSAKSAIRYKGVFNYLEQENLQGKVVFVSATPFSALFSTGEDSILKHNFNTAIVFHKASAEYRGIRQMHHDRQIIKIAPDQRNFCNDSLMRRQLFQHLESFSGPGWALIRVPPNNAQEAKNVCIKAGYSPEQVFIIGQSLKGVDETELTSLAEFKRECEAAIDFDEKVIAITVASFRAGINFGQTLKHHLLATWDSTVANIAAVVQANIGRACGYHNNNKALHFTNLDAISAYSEILAHLELANSEPDLLAIRSTFERICERYEIQGFDRGLSDIPLQATPHTEELAAQTRYQVGDVAIVPLQLDSNSFTPEQFTQNRQLQQAANIIRDTLLDDEGPVIKTNRALRGRDRNWIKAQWVNGVSFDDFSNSMSSARYRTLHYLRELEEGTHIDYETLVNPGGGESVEDKSVYAVIFSVYNLSAQVEKFKRAIELYEMEELCAELGIENDNSIAILFERGEKTECFYETPSKEKQGGSSVFD
ncbi:DEAD/DEAH box helicase family protein [Oceanimonas smirnovii]|uniref:DEAD/DEAH box helicase family protein n=1 Tax=Oceanimonas smirnovii TaxID=264574 RepID=UPI00036AC66D|nr:DEAD/DEAH box helicase family protein [Oceanimonas smirnovii]